MLDDGSRVHADRLTSSRVSAGGREEQQRQPSGQVTGCPAQSDEVGDAEPEGSGSLGESADDSELAQPEVGAERVATPGGDPQQVLRPGKTVTTRSGRGFELLRGTGSRTFSLDTYAFGAFSNGGGLS